MKNDFREIFERILDLSKGDKIFVCNKERKIMFLGQYFAKSCPEESYFKAFFNDGTVLEIMPGSEEFYFGDDPRRDVKKDMNDNEIMVDGKEFVAENDVDYQFVKQIYFGNMEDGEGECAFRDYAFGDEVWSLAVVSATQEKSDILVRKVKFLEIR